MSAASACMPRSDALVGGLGEHRTGVTEPFGDYLEWDACIEQKGQPRRVASQELRLRLVRCRIVTTVAVPFP